MAPAEVVPLVFRASEQSSQFQRLYPLSVGMPDASSDLGQVSSPGPLGVQPASPGKPGGDFQMPWVPLTLSQSHLLFV